MVKVIDDSFNENESTHMVNYNLFIARATKTEQMQNTILQ